jgi:hypothetical protein
MFFDSPITVLLGCVHDDISEQYISPSSNGVLKLSFLLSLNCAQSGRYLKDSFKIYWTQDRPILLNPAVTADRA